MDPYLSGAIKVGLLAAYATLPIAAIIVSGNSRAASLAVVALFLASIVVSPISLRQLLAYPVNLWFAWCNLLAAITLALAVPQPSQSNANSASEPRDA